MPRRFTYYKDLRADYSRPGLVTPELREILLQDNARYLQLKEAVLPQLGSGDDKAQVEAENKEWFPTHCEALRSGRFDLLGQEYRDEYVYLCQDGPFYGKENDREKHWVALLAQPEVTMTWPIVMFAGEVVYFEWQALDDVTGETIARGNVTFLRRGHRGGISVKTEQLTFYRDVSAPTELLGRLKLEGGRQG
jgi:hypothetical protein